jgi:thioredoxin reductase
MNSPDVLIVGGGPAGLSCALRLKERGVASVLVVEREDAAGGIPRHSVHQGYGVRDLHRLLTGPAYARTLVHRARDRGVDILLRTTVTSIGDDGTVSLSSPTGLQTLTPRAIVMATGARERPRAARLVPGDRPAGVFTTGQLQQWVALHELPVGHRAVVVGAEHVAYSAVLTLRHAGVDTVALLTEFPHHQSARGASVVSRLLWRAPTIPFARVTAVHGRTRVERVEYEDLRTGQRHSLACDTVVFTGDWIPDVEVARRSGVDCDAHSGGPRTDLGGRTSRPHVYAAGNLVHPVETADRAALTARAVADEVANDLAHGPVTTPAVELVAGDGLAWVWPQRVPRPSAHRLQLRFSRFARSRTVVAEQGGHVVGTASVRSITPGQHRSVSAAILRHVQPENGPVTLRVASP